MSLLFTEEGAASLKGIMTNDFEESVNNFCKMMGLFRGNISHSEEMLFCPVHYAFSDKNGHAIKITGMISKELSETKCRLLVINSLPSLGDTIKLYNGRWTATLQKWEFDLNS